MNTHEDPPSGTGLRKRPAFLRALGHAEPPQLIQLGDGEEFRLVEIFKHDSWAATALYGNTDTQIVAKFNRRQPLLVLPMRWLGRRLAQRESQALRLLHDIDCVPEVVEEVMVHDRIDPTVTAHVYVVGHPLHIDERPRDDFFPTLDRAIHAMHQRGMAYVDLNKRENIIVTETGDPLLVDFQIHFHPPRWLAWLPPVRWILRELQAGDLYHLQKHIHWNRPDLVPPDTPDLDTLRPTGARLWRKFYTPLLAVRRKLLIKLKVRGEGGLAVDELEPEKAARITRERAANDPDARTPGNL